MDQLRTAIKADVPISQVVVCAVPLDPRWVPAGDSAPRTERRSEKEPEESLAAEKRAGIMGCPVATDLPPWRCEGVRAPWEHGYAGPVRPMVSERGRDLPQDWKTSKAPTGWNPPSPPIDGPAAHDSARFSASTPTNFAATGDCVDPSDRSAWRMRRACWIAIDKGRGCC